MKFLHIRKAEIRQPAPVFFTQEQINRMNKQEGSYQYKGGDSNGKKTDT